MISTTSNHRRRRRRRRLSQDCLDQQLMTSKLVMTNKTSDKKLDLNLINRNNTQIRKLNYNHKSLNKSNFNNFQNKLLILLLCCSLVLIKNLSNCQTVAGISSEQPTQMFSSQQPTLIGNEMEPRADVMKQTANQNALNELFNILSNYAPANNQATGSRRPQLSAQNQLLQNSQTANQNNRIPISTPGNTFLNNMATSINNRQRPIQFPIQQMGSQLNFASSSPPTPINYLTLNRLASFANSQQPFANNNQQNNNNNNNNNNRIQFNQSPNQMMNQPAQMQNQNQNNLRGVTIPLAAPPRGVQPVRTPSSQLNPALSPQMRPLQNIIPIPPTNNLANNLNLNLKQTSGGFAPSGPPPSMANGSATSSTNASVFVQSPTNVQQKQQETTTGASNELLSSSSTVDSFSTSEPTSGQGDEVNKIVGSTTETVKQSNEQQEASNWNPVELNRTSSSGDSSSIAKNRNRTLTSLAPSPDIVTVPPGYNPDTANNQPQNYELNVSAQMGGPGVGSGSSNSPSPSFLKPVEDVLISTPTQIIETAPSSISSQKALNDATINVAPTAVTTIIWSPPPASSSEETNIPSATISAQSSTLTSQLERIQPTAVVTDLPPTRISSLPPTRIRDNSLLNDDPSGNNRESIEGVVYGKSQTRDQKPTAPPKDNASPENAGRPYIQSVQLDNQVRPYAAGSSKPSSGVPFKPSKPLNGQKMAAGMSIGSGFSITSNGNNQTMPAGDIQDYLANQPPILVPSQSGTADSRHQSTSLDGEQTISAHGGRDPFQSNNNSQDNNSSVIASSSSSSSSTTSSPPIKIRRPTFKPKPAVPPIRIDSCIVGDDSSCDQSHNERCVTEYGISSCHCKPGFARLSQLRGYCSPISQFQLSMRIERLSDDRKLAFNYTLENPNSEEYQYLEFETVQALASAIQQTSLGKQFMGTKVNKFFERKGKVWANVSVNFELNNLTRSERVQSLAAQELNKVIFNGSGGRRPIGESTIVLDTKSEPAVSRLTDVNECASKELNDCSKFATCINDFGGYQCQCMAGYEDKHHNWQATANSPDPLGPLVEKSKLLGRVCLGCSPSYCSNRGECSIQDGKKTCKCRANFIGTHCDIDSEVLTVAVGGSMVGIVILVITFWCLYIFNRRWKREQQKMDAMSATSGHTLFNYVNNSSTNSLMSPSQTAGKLLGGLPSAAAAAVTGRSMAGATNGHQMMANYGHKFLNGTSRAYGVAPDQQAIIGSTSSSSSAASQPIGAAMYQYAAAAAAAEEAGLLIAQASNGSSSEQTSPSSNGGNYSRTFNMLLPGNAYTLSGHHHHNQQQQFLLPSNHSQPSGHHQYHHHHHHHNKQSQLTQFNPSSDYNSRTMNNCHYDNRWRTLQQEAGKQQVVGYYLSPDMLINNQQQQLYASPQRELCIDTGNKSARRHHQSGRAQQVPGMVSQRARLHRNSSMYIDPEYEQDR